MKVIRMRLKKCLEERGITRYALAKKTGIKYQTIDNYYKNTVTRYDNDNVVKILVALDCQVGDLLELAEEEKQ